MVNSVISGLFGYTSTFAIAGVNFELPNFEEILRVITLRDYNTKVVILGTMLLGLATGIIGTFMLMRKRSLMGDAVSHATLPGIGLAFIVMTHFGGKGKYFPGLLLGALLSGLLGMGFILLIRNVTRIKEDAALGIVLSVFFGLGAAILGVIQKMKTGHAAGLESFIYGKTASMLASDAKLIAAVAVLAIFVCCLLYKEFSLLCFDQSFALSQGWPVLLLDILMMIMVVVVTVIGLQAVGLILIIALLIIPSAAARFWSDNLLKILLLSGVFGMASGLFGAGLSAFVPRLPAGALIVVVAATIFALSLLMGAERGLIPRLHQEAQLNRKVGRQHLLRAIYEWMEKNKIECNTGALISQQKRGVSFSELLEMRSWPPKRLKWLIKKAQGENVINEISSGSFKLTKLGMADAKRIVRNHRLWEIYLITHADIAPSKVDRDADQIEHVLGKVLVDNLESLLKSDFPQLAIPSSPHKI